MIINIWAFYSKEIIAPIDKRELPHKCVAKSNVISGLIINILITGDKASDNKTDMLTIMRKHSLGVFYKCSKRSPFINSIGSTKNDTVKTVITEI